MINVFLENVYQMWCCGVGLKITEKKNTQTRSDVEGAVINAVIYDSDWFDRFS